MQILQVRKEDSGFYICSAKNILGSVEKKTSLVVVSPPPSKIVGILGCNMTMNCSTTGDPEPTIIWRKQEGQIPVERRLQINGALVLTNLTLNDTGNYSCVITSASPFQEIETVTSLEVNETAGALNASSILDCNVRGKYLLKLNSFLVPVLQSPSRSRFVKCWRAKTDGWAASTFHSNCDGKGPTVTIIEVGSYIFGGYTDASWSNPPYGSCYYASSSKSFIYSLYNIKGYAPVKLRVKSGKQSLAIFRCSRYGPTFGSRHDIHIYDNATSNRYSYTLCGHSYPLPPGYSSSDTSCRFYAGGESHKFTPTDIEVFYETTT
ncbi:roundabout homolog 1-like [Montipora capricornis]|uniref:roundabout homolog 1-like n=1 Tax=Montipora capricornis TaxID=246305 RepID=UPI0035F1491C